ncbi:hypothetical protein K438DRAFT_1704954 [Mycena galopus ATCC 62051]|nr:hypothetical protein K438DRAFT_1704954 [Mycena galopus ATCC 62051]
MAPIDMTILRELSNTAKDFLKDTYRIPSPAASQPLPVIAVLPDAPSIQSKLLRLGLAPVVAANLSSKYDLRCQELRSRAQSILHRTCLELAAVPRHAESIPLLQLLESVTSSHTTWYLQSVRDLEERAMAFASSLKPSFEQPQQPRRTSKPTLRKPSTVFNREFIPFLEKYLEYNAYPSPADRAEMAKKSQMEPRQIEVWFQNKRRRAKEEGRSVRKQNASDPAPLELCLKSMEEKMEPYLIPEALRQEVDSEVSEPGSDEEEEDDDDIYEEPEIIDLTDNDVLNPPAPRYVPSLKFHDCLQFASTNSSAPQFSFPPPTWARTAAVTPPKYAMITMDDITTAFATLHVHDTRTVLSPSFQIPTTVIPPRAPLTALVRGKFKFAPAPVLATTSLNTAPVPASPSRQHSFSPYTQPATLVPASVPASASPSPRRKKASGPPRRTPKKCASNASHRGASPAMSDTSTLRSVSPPSRTPSLESSSFGFPLSRTPSLSFSSSPSDGFSSRSSSGPVTPAGSPAALPLLEIADLDAFNFGDVGTFRRFEYAASPVEEAPKPQQRQFGFAQYASQG